MSALVIVKRCRRIAARGAVTACGRRKIVYAGGYWHGVLPIKKPALGGLGDVMEFTDYMVVKLVVLTIAAVLYGFWLGITGR